MIYHYTDWTGERKQSQKRGFKTKREALAWEREQLNKATANLDMTFASFVEQYTADMKTRIKENTWATKEHIIRTKLLPYFGKLKMCNITAQQIITWQNEMLDHKDENGKKYSPAYLRSVNNQLSAIFNHAVRYYDLRENPCKKAGSMGKKKNRKMLFWTKEEYLKFAEVMMDKPLSFYAFEMLYWCGIREGELLALTPADFDFEKCTVSITKSYQRLNGQDLITTPKTEKSNRVIKMPQFLADEMQDYLKQLYGIALAEDDAVPLFYSQHIQDGKVVFPAGKEHEYIVTEQRGLLQENTNYLFVKRFTAKEEHRRLQCGVYLARKHPEYTEISTQNKINFISGLRELSECVVYGLYVLFNSTLYDSYYRILNGSTQVNSTEINSMPVPPL